MKIQRIEYMSPLEDVDAENDNIDVTVYLKDGSAYALLLATPSNISWCMENEGIDYFFAYPPPVFVNLLTSENIERAIQALVEVDGEKFLSIYGVKQAKPIRL